MPKPCPFCNQKERIIYETPLVTAFLSNPRLMRGHLLIVSKRHVERLDELTSDERQELFDLAAKLQVMIVENLAQGCDLRINYRPFQKEDGIKINHLHIHLQPRELFDELYQQSQKFETAMFKPLSDLERKRLQTLFVDISEIDLLASTHHK